MTDHGGLVVIVEECFNGYQQITVITAPVPDPDAAASLAYQYVRGHQPRRPSMPKERTVFRMSDGSWLVSVSGAMSKHYFTVKVAEVEGTYPEVAR